MSIEEYMEGLQQLEQQLSARLPEFNKQLTEMGNNLAFMRLKTQKVRHHKNKSVYTLNKNTTNKTGATTKKPWSLADAFTPEDYGVIEEQCRNFIIATAANVKIL